MRPQKRKVQNRLSRSGRMRSATVKRASATNADLVKPGVGYRRGIHPVEPTPATDALLFDLTAGLLRRAAVEIAVLVGAMALVAAAVVYLGRAPQPVPGPSGLDPGIVNVLVAMTALTGLASVLIVLKRWRQGRSAFARLTKDERRCTRAAGPLHVQERETETGTRVHRLRPEGGDWLPIEERVFDALEPWLGEVAGSPAAPDRQAETGGRGRTVPNATVLFHRPTGTIVEIHDSAGELVYRHPCYRPGA